MLVYLAASTDLQGCTRSLQRFLAFARLSTVKAISVSLYATSGTIQHRVELVADGSYLIVPTELGLCVCIKGDAAIHLVNDRLQQA